MYRQQLTRKEAELIRAEETIRREQQQHMRQLVHIIIKCRDREVVHDYIYYITSTIELCVRAHNPLQYAESAVTEITVAFSI